MPVQRIQLRPGFDVSRIRNQSIATLINCYAEGQQGKGDFPIVGWPGPTRFAQLEAPIRGLFVAPDGTFYAVGGRNFYRVETDGSFVVLGQVSGSGPVEIDSNRRQIIICAAPRVFVYRFDTAAYSEVRQSGWPGASTVAVISGFALYGVPGADQFFISQIDDASVIQSLNFATAESLPDQLLAIRVVQGEPWFLGSRSIEAWQLSGAANFPFSRSGINQDIGLIARDTAKNYGNGLMFMGRDRLNGGISVYRAVTSYQPQKVSTHAVDRVLERAVHPERAFAYVWRVEGHTFYVISCDAGTLVYDDATEEWHQMGAGLWPLEADVPAGRYVAQAYLDANVLGDDMGRLVKLSFDVHAELDGPMVREIVTGPVLAVGKYLQIHAIELEMEGGRGGLKLDPQILLSLSRDGGHTWDNVRMLGSGLVGAYTTRVRWNRLGRARDLVARFRMTDAGPFHITSAWADVELLATS